MMPLTLPKFSSVDHDRPISSDIFRKRELERLYRRRTALDDLIRSVKIYQRTIQPTGAERAEFSATRTFRSDSAR